MPKYKSVSVKKPRVDPVTGYTVEGRMNLGIAAWVPLNDAAKANKSMVERAVELKAHKIKPGEEPDKMKRMLLRKTLASKGIPIPSELQD